MKLTTWFIFSCVALCFCNSVLIENLDWISVDDNFRDCASKVMASIKLNRSLIVAMMAVDDAVAEKFYEIENSIFISRDQNWYSDTLPTDVYIVMSKDIDDLKNKIGVLKNDSYWNPRCKIVLIFEQSYLENELVMFLRKYNIVNVAIIAKTSKGTHEIQVFGPVLDSCNKPLQLESVGYCTEVDINKIFSVRKEGKLDKCHVKFITHTFLPYTGTVTAGLKGVENYVMDLIHEALGITFELVRHARNKNFGNVKKNGTFSGMLKRVSKYDAEGAVGGIYINSERSATFHFNYPFVIDHLKVVIARADLLGTWEAVVQQLNFTILIFIFTLFVIFSLAATALMIFPISPKENRDVIRNFLIIWGFFFNNVNIRNISPRLSPRIIVIDMLMFTIVMYSVIQALLSSATTKPIRERQATKVKQVMESHYPIIQEYFKVFQKLDIETCKTVNECIIKVNDSKGTNRPMYAVIPETYYNFFKWHFLDNKGYFQIYALKDSVGNIWQSMCFVKGSTVLPAIEKVIENMVSSHLIAHYSEVLDHFHRLKHFYSFRRQPLKKHDIYEIAEVFFILLCGLSLSFVVFLIEVVSYKLKKRNTNVLKLSSRYDTNRQPSKKTKTNSKHF